MAVQGQKSNPAIGSRLHWWVWSGPFPFLHDCPQTGQGRDLGRGFSGSQYWGVLAARLPIRTAMLPALGLKGLGAGQMTPTWLLLVSWSKCLVSLFSAHA